MRNLNKGTASLLALAVATAGTLATAGAVVAQDDDQLVVGVSWNNYNEERWARADEVAIKNTIEELGGRYVSTNAKSSAAQQADDIDLLLTLGVDALIVLAQDGTAIIPSVQAAIDEGVPVIAYDRLIEDPRAFYITFDNTAVGRLQAEHIFGLVPEGRYAIIKGNEADANAKFFLREGYDQVIKEAVDSGAIEIVCETFTDDWAPANATTNMEQCLTQADNDIDAVLSMNDGMATGIVVALDAQGLTGIPLSGQDGDFAALNRVARGDQTVSVWKDAFALGRTAAKAAVDMANGVALTDITAPSDLPDYAKPPAGDAAVSFTTPNGVELPGSITLNPLAVTVENFNVPIDSGWIPQAVACQGVDAGSVPGC